MAQQKARGAAEIETLLLLCHTQPLSGRLFVVICYGVSVGLCVCLLMCVLAVLCTVLLWYLCVCVCPMYNKLISTVS